MNERIRELAEQADKWSAEEYHQLFLANESPDRQKFFNEKFAELIVKECAELNFRELGLSGSSSFDVSRMIKQHFGVEE